MHKSIVPHAYASKSLPTQYVAYTYKYRDTKPISIYKFYRITSMTKDYV